MGGKSATISAANHPGTWIKTDAAVAYSVASVTMKFVGKCYNQDSEKATVTVLAYSDAGLTTKVAETPAQEVPAISDNDGVETLTFTFATAPAANMYYKINFDIINTTTYNGVVALEKVTFNAAGGETPVEIAQPSDTFSGTVTVGGQGVFTTIALADAKAFVELGDTKAVLDYTFDKATGLVTIPLGGNYGNLKGTYDAENNKLVNCGLDGAAAAMVTNNGSLEFAGSKVAYNCDGTDAELQAIFKRRVGSSENGLVVADTTNKVAGQSAVQLPGNGSGDVRLNLKQDISGGVTAKNLGYWVFNPSANNVKVRMWVYKAANLQSNAELTQTPVEMAPGWNYYRAGFTEAKIYNIQIADFSNSGVNLTFDNIAIF